MFFPRTKLFSIFTQNSIAYTNLLFFSILIFQKTPHFLFIGQCEQSQEPYVTMCIYLCKFFFFVFFTLITESIFMRISLSTHHAKKFKKRKKKYFTICAHYRPNMNWPKSQLFDAFLVSAALGYLIWIRALGSLVFLQYSK